MILWLQILNLLLFPQVCWGWLYGLGAFMVKMRKTVRTGVPSSSVRKRTGTSQTPASAEGFTSAPREYQLNRKLRSFEPTKSKRSLKTLFLLKHAIFLYRLCPTGLYWDDVKLFCNFKDQAICGPVERKKKVDIPLIPKCDPDACQLPYCFCSKSGDVGPLGTEAQTKDVPQVSQSSTMLSSLF